MTTHRKFHASRRIRVGDCASDGIVRVDALARYLQDIGYDDTDDIGVGDGGLWVARSISMSFPNNSLWPMRNQMIDLETYCGGIGRAIAQRNVTITTENGSRIDTSTIWVCVSEEGKPMRVPEWLTRAYPDAEKISAARTLSVSEPQNAQTAPDLTESVWHLRASDFDINDHANNAVAFDALYDVAQKVNALPPSSILVEYHQPVTARDAVRLMWKVRSGGFDAWLASDEGVAAAMRWTY